MTKKCVVCDKFIWNKGKESYETFFMRIRHKKCEGKPVSPVVQKRWDESRKKRELNEAGN